MDMPNYYAIIPASVRYDKRLQPSAKLLFGEITALINKKGYCFATNEYFQNLYNVDVTTVRRWLQKLAKYGYIKITICRLNDNKNTERKIYALVDNMCITNTSDDSKGAKMPVRGGQKCPLGEGKNAPHINTRKNTTSINNNVKNEKEEYIELAGMLITEHRKYDEKFLYNKNENEIKKRWASDFRKLVEIDGRDIDSVKQVIIICQRDEFWRNNILSGKKLRDHFPKFVGKIKKREERREIVYDETENEAVNKIYENMGGKCQ